LTIEKTADRGLTGTFEYRITGPNGFDETAFVTVTDDDEFSDMEYGSTTMTIPPGDYIVEEVLENWFACTDSSDYGPDSIAVNQVEVTVPLMRSDTAWFYNVPNTGTLTINKTAEMGLTGTFQYRVTGPYGFDETVFITITDDDEFSDTEYGSITMTVPAGEITIAEISGSDFVCDFPFDYQHTIQMPLQDSVAVEFINIPLDPSYIMGNIEIVKNVQAGLYGTFEFLVTLPDEYTPPDDTIFEHNAYITINEGDETGTYTLYNVPAGYIYTVTEMQNESSICIDPSSYQDTVTFSQGSTGTIEFTNIPRSYLEIRKYVTGGLFGTFEFIVDDDHEFLESAFITIEEGDSSGSVIIEVPAEKYLFIQEVLSPSGEWIPDPYSTSIMVALGQTAVVEFTNNPKEVDDVPPTTTITLDPASPDGANGWYKGNVHVTISATDTGGIVTETRSVLDPVTPPATFSDIPAANPYGGTGADVTSDGEHTIYAASIDNSGNIEAVKSESFKIDKVAPVINISTPADMGVYAKGMALDFSASDPGGSGLATLLAWLDSTPVSSGYKPQQGVYELTITATDQAGNSQTEVRNFVIYDPKGGFVSGGGWIDSPEGAYIADPALTGKAYFWFVSKYAKGKALPTGNAEFHFDIGQFHFTSTSYDWLVVNKTDLRAQLQGTGEINGEGEYKFMLWVTDAEIDTFRIKIWEETGGVETVIYDNGVETPIGGGSITVHISNPRKK
jgi:hypothetical protein